MQNGWKRPSPLKKGSTVTLIAPAGKIPAAEVQLAIRTLESWGWQVKPGKFLFSTSNQFAGTDEQRLTDLQQALDDPKVQAIICARGGYGTTRILDRLDFSKFQQNPKWVVGYSDITALHCHLHQLGVESLHATMPLLFNRDTPQSINSLKDALSGRELTYRTTYNSLNRLGRASGVLIGGNLSLLVTIMSTRSEADTTGKILFLEDINEYLYHIDRMMVQLKRAGKFQHLAGLVVGHFTDSKDNETPFGKTAYEIIAEAVQEYNFPVCYGFPTGHEPENWALPCGRLVQLEVGSNGVKLWTGAPVAAV